MVLINHHHTIFMAIIGIVIEHMNPYCVARLIDWADLDWNKLGGRTEVAQSQWNAHPLIWSI